jgi:LytS/YehU family sensor histidine kinase
MELLMLVVIFIFGAELDIKAANFNALFLIAGMYIPVVVGIAIKLYRTWQRSEEANLRLLQQKTEQELNLLKSQIHPHFLFNTLNNLYTLIHEKSDLAGNVVLQLSDLLSFILYDCKANRITLGKELRQIENYIALEKLRYGNRVDVKLVANNDVMDVSVLPLILLPLVENSFKHGVKSTLSQSFIFLEISRQDEFLLIRVENSHPGSGDQVIQGGLGLENLRNRLELAYNGDYQLKIDKTPTIFTLLLKIPIHEKG